MSGTFGLIPALIGMDNISGLARFTFGTVFLMNGLSFIPVMVGLFAMSQCFLSMEELYHEVKINAKITSAIPTLADLKKIFPTVLRAEG